MKTEISVYSNSWIPPIASSQVNLGVAYGTIHDHVHASAYTDTPSDELLARPRWAFPLCGGNPQHWVLGMIDFTRNEIAVFDSIPELNSMNEWAEKILIKAANAVMACLGKPILEWSPVYWKRKVYSPLEYHGQIDGWSCGLFVMMAMDVFAKNGSYDSVTDDKKDAMKNKALEMLMTLPVTRVTKKATYSSDDDRPVEIVNKPKARCLRPQKGQTPISHILDARKSHQSETKVHSEGVVTIDPKFALHRVIEEESASKSKLSISREYSHRLAVTQKLDIDFKNPTKAREER
ncbi:hypothetical protein EDD22DRAFT_1000332 [Suillus occidentalis]|nr:hypothetical protein EDD22DRAFT_1000332 [Suillus occidentalis]